MSWTIGTVTEALRGHLASRGLQEARLDAELLVAHVLGCSRTHLYIHPDQPLSDAERAQLRELSRRRAQHEPLAYLVGEREFFGHALKVTPDVLIPRPETEHLVEAALRWLGATAPPAPRILDVGVGSGAVAIALALACDEAQVVAVDISAAALAVARDNVVRHGLVDRVTLIEADLFCARHPADEAALGAPFDVIVSNPPYVRGRDAHSLPKDVQQFEPHQALFGGEDGLSIVARLCREAPSHLKASGFFACEMGFDQAREVGALLGDAWAGRAAVRDLAGHWRIACAWQGCAYVPGAQGSRHDAVDPIVVPHAPEPPAQAPEDDGTMPEIDINCSAQVVRRHRPEARRADAP